MSFAQDVKALYGGEAVVGRYAGQHVGTAAEIIAVATFGIFNVTGGDVLLTGFYGKVTTVIGAGASTLIVVYTPTGGAQNAMSATSASIAADPVNTIYMWDGLLAGVLMPLGAAAVGVGNGYLGCWTAKPLLVGPGQMGIANAVNALSGAIDWYAWYVPMWPGARMVAV